MIRLQHKLWLGFGALLFVLLVVSGLSIYVFTRFSHTLEGVFRENYDSVIYCQTMKEQLDVLDTRAQASLWDADSGPVKDFDQIQNVFEQNLYLQFGNISLPGERDRTQRLSDLWHQLAAHYRQFNSAQTNRVNFYRQDLLPRFWETKQIAQQIADMNMNNMGSVNGVVKQTLGAFRNALLVLVITAVLLSAMIVWTAGASMLYPLRSLTRSARQIEAGDLDLMLQVRSRDEIGLLAEAFNSMAKRLREFRQLDRDRLERTQQTTQLAIDTLPDAVFVIGPNQSVEMANVAAKTHFEIEIGKTLDKLSLRWLTPLYESILLHQKPIEPHGYSAAVQLFDHGEERFLLPRRADAWQGARDDRCDGHSCGCDTASPRG